MVLDTRSSLLVAVVVALLASVFPAAPATATPIPPPYPTRVAALGDSITRAFNTGSAFVDAPANSWTTGSNAAVNSLATRFGATTTTNLAVTGAKMAGLNSQAAGVNPATEFVTILIGGNDVCTPTEAAMTPVATFGSQFTTAMNTLTTVAPNAQIYVVSIPDVSNLWTLLHNDFGAQLIWGLFSICQSLLDNPASMAQADVDRRARVRQRNIDFNTKLSEVCATFAKCKTDGNAVFNGPVAVGDISTRDYFHPSLAGQTKLAATAWGPDTVGGKNLKISGGSINLSWDGGTLQNGYTLLRYNTSTAAATLVPAGGHLTNYSDASATPGVVYCYVLAATGSSGVLGLSDLVCGLTGLQGGTVVPGSFGLSLRQTANATLTWTAPAGGADSYLLVTIPLDGAPSTNVALPGSAVSSTQPVIAAGACFQLVAFKGAGNGQTNVFCGLPGVSTLAAVSQGGSFDSLSRALTNAVDSLPWAAIVMPDQANGRVPD